METVLYGLRIAWVSVASVVLGALLFWVAPQVQDLFLEVTGNPYTNAGYWLAFYIAVMAFWGLPVYVSSSWILSRFEEGSTATDSDIKPIKVWVRQYIPPLLAVACFGAVLLGQTMALSNAPDIVSEPQRQEEIFAAPDVVNQAEHECTGIEGLQAVCFLAVLALNEKTAPALAALLLGGSEQVILAALKDDLVVIEDRTHWVDFLVARHHRTYPAATAGADCCQGFCSPGVVEGSQPRPYACTAGA